MNILIVTSSSVFSGGGNQYEKLVSNLLVSKNDKNIFYYLNSNKKNISNKSIIYKDNFFNKIIRILSRNLNFYKILESLSLNILSFEKKLINKNIDLVYFLSSSFLAEELVTIPFITTVWDLEHKKLNNFPELNKNKEIEKRDNYYSRILKKAFKIIVESETTKNDIKNFYLIDHKKIDILPFFIDENEFKNKDLELNISEISHYSKKKYIFYPAQFWSHKNHIYLVNVMEILKKNKINITLVLTGSDKGNLNFIKNAINSKGLNNQIDILGFVSRKKLIYLYKNALALVMPTLIGPTNIPPLEGLASNIFVCHSDKKFAKNQLQDAAIYFDVKNPNSLAEIVNDLLNTPEKYAFKKINGRRLLDNWTQKDFYNKIIRILDEYEEFSKTWK